MASLFITFFKRWKNIINAFSNKKAIFRISIGSFFGPFLGISLSLYSVQYITTGVASTIMSIVPILLIPAHFIIYRQKVKLRDILGSFISLVGVALFFL